MLLRSAGPEGAAAAVSRVFEAIDAFVCGAPQYDDITIVVARRAVDA